ncbi:MAG: hypothetical protein KatS3mg027_0971 [Bacteroidia bacterium]|nr:MAG: hypothetical protein KatS3mg027_0971 [Bacteroidia bacterium]
MSANKHKLTLFTLVIFLVLITNLNAQTDNLKTNVYSQKSSKPKKEINITDEDTIIRTPTQVMIVKKKDYYSGKHIQREIKINPGDSVVETPEYKRIIRKNTSKESQRN